MTDRSVLPIFLAVLLASSCSTLGGDDDASTAEEVVTETPPLGQSDCAAERAEYDRLKLEYDQLAASYPWLSLKQRADELEEAEKDLQQCRSDYGRDPEQYVFDYAQEVASDDLNVEAVDQLVRWAAHQCVGTTLTGLEEQIQRSRQLVVLAHSGNIDDDPELIDEILNDHWARTVFEDPEGLSGLLDLSDLWSELAEWSCTGELPTGS